MNLRTSSVGSKFEERTQNETVRQERCACGAAWNLAKDVCELKKESQDTFYSLAKAWVMPAPSSKKSEERQSVIDSGASMHVSRKKKHLSSGELETLKRSRTPITVLTANGEVQTNEETQVYVHDLHIFVTVQLQDTPSVLFLDKLCKEHGYTCEWPSSREPRLTKNGKQTFCKSWNFVPLLVQGLSSSSTSSRRHFL